MKKIEIPPVKSIHEGKSNCREYVDILLSESNINLKEAVNLINEKYPDDQTTYQNYLNKVLRGTLRDYELAQLADVCGYQLCMIPKVDSDNKSVQDSPRQPKPKAQIKKVNNDETNYQKMLKMIGDGYDSILSHNFGVVTFAGENAVKAASNYHLIINSSDEKQIGELTPIRELTIIKLLEKEFNVLVDFLVPPQNSNIGE